MKKTTVLLLLMTVASAYAQNLKTSIDASLLNQGAKGINAIKLRNSLHLMTDSLRLKPTKFTLGLGNVDNTSDLNKPISSATQIELNKRLSILGGTVNGLLNVQNGGIVTNNIITNTFRLAPLDSPEGTTFEGNIIKANAGGFGTWVEDLSVKNLDFANNSFSWSVGGASFAVPPLLTLSEANSNYAQLAANNNFTGINKFLTPIFANSTSTSAYSSITGAWNNIGNLGIFSFRYNTRFGSNTVTWNPIRMDYNGQVGIGMDPTQAFEVLGAAKFNSTITATSISASSNIAALSFSSTTGANFATNSGNVGVGTGSPDRKLVVDGQIGFSYGDGGSYVGLSSTADKLGLQFFAGVTSAATNNSYRFSDNVGQNVLVIQNGGNVGISTVLPEQKLHVEGLVKIKAYTTTEINALTGMTIGTITINSTIGLPVFYNGTSWKRFDGSSM